MTEQKHANYVRVEKAIHYLNEHFQAQPSLDEIAQAIHLSPYHFQRIFSEWAGVSPKKFMQFLSLNHAKNLLKDQQGLLEVTYDTGLSSYSRLHDLFITIEGMTPNEFKNGGADLIIHYDFADSPFGPIIIASTAKGVCHMAFEHDENKALAELKTRFPNAQYKQGRDKYQQDALVIFQKDWTELDKIKLHLAGTAFQLKVWESLLKIPFGSLVSYGEIAQAIGKPKSARAVGSAIGSNPIAFIIPCHRVIQSSGKISGYLWGEVKKKAIIGWEAAKIERELPEIK